MRMPDILAYELNYCEKAANEEELWDLLIKMPPELVGFFEYSSADETWSNEYAGFTKKALEWFTNQYFQDKLHDDLAKRIGKCIQGHYANLEPYLPFNINIQLKNDREIKVNSLLLQTASDFLKQLVRSFCYENNRNYLVFKEDYQHFAFAEEFINTGDTKEMWRLPPEEIKKIFVLARSLEIKGLCDQCERILKRYIAKDNVYETLENAKKESMEILKQGCFDLINALNAGIQLSSLGPGTLVCDLDAITEESSDQFKHVMPYVTHLICGTKLADDPAFGDLLKKCPALVSIDLGKTQHFSDQLLNMPPSLQELSLAGCRWLTNDTFKKLILMYPSVKRLNLTSCTQIGSQGWGELLKLRALVSLNLNRCAQISDQDLMVIVHSIKGIADLDLSECKKITDKGFSDLSRSTLRLITLNAGRTNISDAPLIELLMRMHTLNYLDLTRCPKLTEIGIVEAVTNSRALKVVNLTHCNIPLSAVERLRHVRSFLQIIYES